MTIDAIAGERGERPPGDWGGYASRDERNEAIWLAILHEGLSQRSAARRFHLSPAGIAEIMAEMRGKLPRRERIDMRIEMTERLDALSEALWPLAMAGDPAAHRELRGHMDRLAKLHGLDEPTKSAIDANVTGAVSPDTLRALQLARAAMNGVAPITVCPICRQANGQHLDQCERAYTDPA